MKTSKISFIQGEMLEGVVEIAGGRTDQEFGAIHLYLKTLYGREGSDKLTNTTLYTHKLNDLSL